MIIFPTAFFLPPAYSTLPKVVHNIDGLFTKHNLGTISGPVDSLFVARLRHRNIACDEPVFMKTIEEKGTIYVSRYMFYHPVVHSFISRQETYHETIYRWNQVSLTGQLLQSIIING